MDYLRLFVLNKKLLGFGIIFTFFSSFGKTFIISQFIPFILKEYQLSNTGFSIIYALVTIASAAIIIYLGQLLDRTELKKYSLFVTFGLIASILLLGISNHIFLLVLGLFGLRLTGQGLMNHTSLTAMSRFFRRSRGKAVSIAVLGHSLGEAFLPFVVVLFIHSFGWRSTLTAISGIVFILLVPAICILLNKIPKVKEKFIQVYKKKKVRIKQKWSIKKVFYNNQFYLIAPNLLVLPFISTALMFYMVSLAHFKGWSSEWISVCFIGFGLANFCSAFIAGQFIDRSGAMRFLPYNFLPLIGGIAVVLLVKDSWGALLFLILAGVSNGFNLTLETAAITEVFGLKNIATVKSIFSTFSILATAMGPLVFGFLLDLGFDFNQILLFCLLFLSLVTVNSLRGYSKKHQRLKSMWSIPRVIISRK